MSDPAEVAASSPSGLDRLLAALDPVRDQAADKLVLLRRKLLKYFAWNRAPFPDELADEVLDRVARRLQEGETIRNGEPGAYVYGFARNVLRESRSRPRLVRGPDDLLAPAPAAEQQIAERRSRCLDACLARLPEESRRLLLAYYRGDTGAERIASRRALAAEQHATPGTLRLRMHRLRGEIQGCVRSCLAEARETETSSTHVQSKDR